MPFHANWIGRPLGAVETAVDARRVLAFAACIGETAPEHFDDARPGGIIAPPSFCVVPEWRAVRAARADGLGGLATDEQRRVVHAGQDTFFHNPIRPGDRLRTEVVLVEARAIPAGALAVLRLSTVESASGNPAATTLSSFVYRCVALAGEAGRIDVAPAMPAAPSAALPADAAVREIPIPRTLPHTYTEGADIWNPIHTERIAALAAGLPDIILHGTATWALAARELCHAHGLGPAAVRRLAGRFAGFVVPGAPIRLRHAGTGDGHVGFEVLNAAGERAIERGLLAFSHARSPMA